MATSSNRIRRWAFAIAVVSFGARHAAATEAGLGMFHVTLNDHPAHCSLGVPITTPYTSTFTFDDKTFMINVPPGNNLLQINFSLLGTFTATNASLDCVFDEGGTFVETAVSELGDLEWEITGEYMDHKPDISEGDPFPFVGRAACTTTRTDDFETLCDNFEFSFNGLGKALAPNPEGVFHDFAGDFTLRTAPRVPVVPNPGANTDVAVQLPVDAPGGDVPEVQVMFKNGVAGPGELRVTTLADAHGAVPPGLEFPVRGTIEIDHGAGPVPFFAGGDERFVELKTTAPLPSSPSIEVCLPLPVPVDPSGVRPARVLHGEGSDPTTRQFVDRTSHVDPKSGMVCAKVPSFSKFAVVTTDICGGGQRRSDGVLTVAGGLIGKKTVVVDGLTDCTQYPANLPKGLARFCVPDADATPGQCTISVTLGINRGGCNHVSSGVIDPHSPSIDVSSYLGELKQGASSVNLTPVFGPAIAALASPIEATVGPMDLVLPAARKITTYKIKHQLTGVRPGTTSRTDEDKDLVIIKCIDPAQF